MMRSLITSLLFSSLAFSLDANNVEIVREVDEMTEDVTYRADRDIYNADKGNSLMLVPNLNSINDDVFATGVSVLTSGIGCVENSLLVILLENGDKIKAESSIKFNCDGFSSFDIEAKEWLNKIRVSAISKVMFRNGRDFKTIKFKVKENDKYFLKRIVNLIINDKY